MKKPVRVAIYARFSTDMQNPMSIKDQERECRKHADREGWTVVQVFSDTAVSGATKGRPGYDALLAAVKAGQFDVVLFEHLDRLARDLEFLMAFYKEARHVDCELHQLRRGKLGIFDIGILGTFAQIFLEELSFKTRRGLVGKIEAGKSAGGLSYGYKLRRNEAGEVIKGEQVIDAEEQLIVQRIFTEYAAGKSPLRIAADLNTDRIPAPRGKDKGERKRKSSGHWLQTTINGNRERGTGILNNELYIGRRVWNRLRYSKHPETGKRVSRLNPPEDVMVFEDPDLRIVEQTLWDAVKTRQSSQQRARAQKTATDPNGLSVAQSMRRRKYLLSGLLACGQCGGNLTIAGSGKARRYYCANAKQKGEAICTGMPGLIETDAAASILSGLKTGLMQDEIYEDFRKSYIKHFTEETKGQKILLDQQDKAIADLTMSQSNLLRAAEQGEIAPALSDRLREIGAALEAANKKRAELTVEQVELPEDLPSLHRAYVDDIAETLTYGDVAGRAGEAMHALVDSVVVDWDAEERVHTLELRGKLLELLNVPGNKKAAGLASAARSLKLVAGACNRRNLPDLMCSI